MANQGGLLSSEDINDGMISFLYFQSPFTTSCTRIRAWRWCLSTWNGTWSSTWTTAVPSSPWTTSNFSSSRYSILFSFYSKYKNDAMFPFPGKHAKSPVKSKFMVYSNETGKFGLPNFQNNANLPSSVQTWTIKSWLTLHCHTHSV